MPTLYLTEDRALVRRDSEDCLLVQIPERREKNGNILSPARKEHIPLVKIDDVVVTGEVTLTASALHLLLERNIDISFLGYYGQFKGRLSPPLSKMRCCGSLNTRRISTCPGVVNSLAVL